MSISAEKRVVGSDKTPRHRSFIGRLFIWGLSTIFGSVGIGLVALAALLTWRSRSQAFRFDDAFVLTILLVFGAFFSVLAWHLLGPGINREAAVSRGTWRFVGMVFFAAAAGLFGIVVVKGAWLYLAAPILAATFGSWCYHAAQEALPSPEVDRSER
jgi:hypothetical protein